MKRIKIVALVLVLSTAVSNAYCARDAIRLKPDMRELKDVGVPALAQKASRLQVEQWFGSMGAVSQEDLAGRVYVVEFWATWCPGCVKIIPKLNELAKKYRQKGVLFIGLSVDRSPGIVKAFVDKTNINYYIGFDKGSDKKFAMQGIPNVTVVNHTGQIVWQGYPGGERLEWEIKNALTDSPPTFLYGLDLGSFEPFRLSLSGGRGFLKAYKTLRIAARGKDSAENQKASKILEEIDIRIAEKIEKAAALRESDPAGAFLAYHDIVKKFQGIECVAPAVSAREELRSDKQVLKEVAAAQELQKVKDFMAKFQKCNKCTAFNPECEECVDINAKSISSITERLAKICEEFGGTNAAKTAEKLSEILK